MSTGEKRTCLHCCLFAENHSCNSIHPFILTGLIFIPRHVTYTFIATIINYMLSTFDSIYHELCYTSCSALAGMRNSSMGPPCGIDPMSYCTMSKHSTTERHPCLVCGVLCLKKQAFITISYSVSRDGQKMSKRKKNYPDPMEIVNEYGADALRYIDDNLSHFC